MIFSKKLRKTAASVLALVMVFAMSTGAFAYEGSATLSGDYYNVTVSYTIEGTVADGTQISIIALAGAEDANATVTYDGSTATNVLWIDQQDAASAGTFEFQVDKTAAATGFNIKSGVTGGNTMTGYVTIATQQPDDDEKSSDATLTAIKVGTVDAELSGETATATVNAAVTKADIAVTKSDANATYEITANDDNTVFTIVVTAEDGTTKTYTLTVTVSGGSTGGGDTGTTIPTEDITIGGNTVTDTTTVIESTKPFGITNGHVVKVELEPVVVEGEVQAPNKVVAHGGKTDGVETFYTEYVIDGETVIKLVTVITDESLTAGELTLVEGEPTKLVYGDIDTTSGVGITSLDVDAIIQISVGNKAVGNTMCEKLIADANGDGLLTSLDVDEIIQMSVGNKTVPAAAKK